MEAVDDLSILNGHNDAITSHRSSKLTRTPNKVNLSTVASFGQKFIDGEKLGVKTD